MQPSHEAQARARADGYARRNPDGVIARESDERPVAEPVVVPARPGRGGAEGKGSVNVRKLGAALETSVSS